MKLKLTILSLFLGLQLCPLGLAEVWARQQRFPALKDGMPVRLSSEQAYRRSLGRAISQLEKPRGKGIVRLDPGLRTLVIPDLHGRRDYLVRVLKSKDARTGERYGSLLRKGQLQVVVLGDAMHAEGRAAARWSRADNKPLGKAMRKEAGESLGTMKLIMDLKAASPEHFHYLKGNHDNILNQRKAGDWPVAKYTDRGEGALLKTFAGRRFGRAFLKRWHRFESLLPIVAVGSGFALAHSGPGSVLPWRAVQSKQARAVESFTWTDLTHDGKQQARLARQQLRELGVPDGFFLVGHRPARRVRKQGQLFQLNNEQQMYFAVLEPNKPFNPARDVHDAR